MLADIKITGNGTQSKVIVNGVDLSDQITKVEYIHEGGKVATVVLSFVPDAVSVENVCEVGISEKISRALGARD